MDARQSFPRPAKCRVVAPANCQIFRARSTAESLLAPGCPLPFQHNKAKETSDCQSSRVFRFVSGGTTDAPIERSDEWLATREELEATRRRKVEELRQSNGRSIYETLEANKGTLLLTRSTTANAIIPLPMSLTTARPAQQP